MAQKLTAPPTASLRRASNDSSRRRPAPPELHQPARNETSPSAPRLVTIAGIAHTKGYHDALMAMRLVRKRSPGATYQIIGEIRDTSYLRFLKRLIPRRWDLSDAVRITPNLSGRQRSSWRSLRIAISI